MGSILGNRVTRVEDPRFLTGRGQYVDSIHFPNEAWCAYVRSPYAHATIESIDVSDAASAPGVLGVFTAADLAGLNPTPPTRPNLPPAMNRPFLAAERVRFVGEPVVAVVAETQAAAIDAAESVVIEYEPLPVVTDLAESVAGEVLIFPDAGTNTVLKLATPAQADFGQCEVVVSERIVNQRLSGAPMEPRVGVAYWTPEGRLVHYSSCQGGHVTKAMLSVVYGLAPHDVRVIVPDVGGGFGVKSRTYPEEAVLGFYAREVGRPVRWSETRTENMLSMPQGRAQEQHATIGGTRDGRITAYQLDVLQDAGAYPLTGSVLHMMTMRMTCGVYDIENVGFTGVSTVTNAPSITAYRGAGRPEAAVAIERMVDRYAAEIGIDPAEVRRRNVIPTFLEARTTGVGTAYDVGDYGRSLELALAAAGYDDLRAEQAARRASGDPVQLGIGIATYVEITSGVGGSEYGAVELQPDGGLLVRTGTTPYGQGHVTTWAMIVSDRTGVPIERITVLHGDTDEIRSGGLTVGSRSVQLGGTAIAVATTKLIDDARQRAAQLLEAAADDVVLDADAGRFHVAGTPARSLAWSDVAAADGVARSPPTTTSRRRCRRSRSAPTSPSSKSTPRRVGTRLRRHVAVRRRGHDHEPAAGRGPDPRRHRPGRRAGVDGGGRLRRGRHAADDELRRLSRDLERRAADVRAGADGHANVGQRARREGHRRVGHDRQHPQRVQRGDRRRVTPRRAPHGDAVHAGEGVGRDPGRGKEA